MRLKACDVSSGVLAAIPARPRPGKVHSVFARTVNVLCAGDLWVSLHPLGQPRHPYSVIVSIDSCGVGAEPGPQGHFLDATAGEAARVSSAAVELGGGRVVISLDEARVWDCTLGPAGPTGPARALGRSGLAGTILRMRGRIGGRGVESPFLEAVLRRGAATTREPDIAGALRRRAAQLLGRMETAWEGRSHQGLAATMQAVVGFGMGLTPAGDDFILGLMAASYYLSECGLVDGQKLAAACRSGVDSGADSTTLLSGLMLKAASQGQWPGPVRDLVASLGPGDASMLDRALGQILEVGATSGQDMLAGVIFGLGLAGPGERRHAANLD